MQAMTLSQAAIACGGTLMHPDCRFDSVAIDSRKLQKGDLFVALEGDRFDAHQFLSDVAQKASGLVVRKADKSLTMAQWVVPDTTIALGQLARLRRDKFNGVVIAITGSSGKTTVKEMLASILSQANQVLATKGNLNNHIGVPLTLLNLQDNHDYAVVEMGASGPNEIDYLCGLAVPDVVLVNNVLPAHVAGFGGLEGIARAKGEIYRGVNPAGTAVINLDESFVESWVSESVAAKTLTFSKGRDTADFYANNIQQDEQGRSQFELVSPVGQAIVQLPLSGVHNVANALAAAACAYAAGATLKDIVAGLQQLQPVVGRLSLHASPNGATIIDDTYNANPGSMKAAIDALMSFSGEGFSGQKILVLGDMAELGDDEVELHAEVGRYVADKSVDVLLGVGSLSRHACDEFSDSNHFETKGALITALKGLLEPDTVVLVKGSRSAAMEDVVQAVIDTGER